MAKPYSQELARENDARARKAVKDYYFSEHGIVLVDFPLGKYGPDLGDPEMGLLIEVEVKRDWKGGKFPFPNLRITKRKLKLLSTFNYPYDTVEFWVLSDNLCHAAIVNGWDYRQASDGELEVETLNFKGVDGFKVIEPENIREFVDLGRPSCGQRELAL